MDRKPDRDKWDLDYSIISAQLARDILKEQFQTYRHNRNLAKSFIRTFGAVVSLSLLSTVVSILSSNNLPNNLPDFGTFVADTYEIEMEIIELTQFLNVVFGSTVLVVSVILFAKGLISYWRVLQEQLPPLLSEAEFGNRGLKIAENTPEEIYKQRISEGSQTIRNQESHFAVAFSYTQYAVITGGIGGAILLASAVRLANLLSVFDLLVVASAVAASSFVITYPVMRAIVTLLEEGTAGFSILETYHELESTIDPVYDFIGFPTFLFSSCLLLIGTMSAYIVATIWWFEVYQGMLRAQYNYVPEIILNTVIPSPYWSVAIFTAGSVALAQAAIYLHYKFYGVESEEPA